MRVIIFLLCLMAALAMTSGKKPLTCSMKQGKKISGFNKAARFSMYLPCKFQALAGQTCGDYKITVSPGNVIDFRGHIFLRTVFMSVTNINPDSPDFEKKWTGRTSIQIAKKYIDGNPKQTQPFNSMFGSVGFGFCDIFTATAETGEKKSFEITEKNGAFSFQYSLIDEDNKKRYKTSGFEFKCYRDVAQEDLKPYPRQICGNGDDSILPQRTSELGFDDDDLTLLFDVLNSTAEQSNFRNKTLGFESEGLFNSSCGRVTNAFERRCDAAERLEAVETCKEILMSNKHIKCLAKDPNTPLPGDVFWYCVEFVCSGYRNEPYCPHLAHAIDTCPEFKAGTKLTKKVREVCGEQYPIITAEEIKKKRQQKLAAAAAAAGGR